ncbi:hypothetical protein LTR85_011826 [Meristemomyces frigidus]|nr:hypothetical protein LTR85_011826 [Meristemomyces frigidus]
MNNKHGRQSPFVLVEKPSSSFSSVSTTSAASATSAASSRSGGNKLLFGEIDTSSDRSSQTYASVCSFVQCDSGTFLKFWLDDKCRDTFLSHLPKKDLASLRLACHDSSVRAAPALFEDLSITFKTSTFTKPARLAALDRLGFYVKTLSFNLPHTSETFLPPLVDPETGAELSYTYTPQIEAPSARRPKYGDAGTTEILTRQYPALFHAATNVPAFIRAFSALINLRHLKVSCPGYDPSTKQRRSIVDFALISLRIAVEQNCLNALDTLAFSPIHPSGLLYLSPLTGYGATPRSASRWSRIRHLTIEADFLPVSAATDNSDPDHFRLLQAYLRPFQANLTTFSFRWSGEKGPLPFRRPVMSSPMLGEHPARREPSDQAQNSVGRRKLPVPLWFPNLKHVEIEHVATSASEISAFARSHKRTLEEVNLENVELTSGTWDDAFAPLTASARRFRRAETADIPIMLSPPTAVPLPATMRRTEGASDGSGRRSLLSNWLSTKARKPTAAHKVRQGLSGCEGHLKKAFGGIMPWL